MMNILKRFKVDFSTYVLLLIYFLCGYIKNALIIYLIVVFHEMGHVIISNICGYKIKKITIYPFGGITETSNFLNSSIKYDLYVFCGGLLFQGILWMFLNFSGWLSVNCLSLFNKYNFFIFVFNLLPIIPLDVYLILNVILNKFFSYYKTLWLSFFISTILLFGFVYFYRSNFPVVLFLFYSLISYLKNIEILYNKFILERYLYDFQFKKIKYFTSRNLRYLRRECFCYFKDNRHYISEKKLLTKKFDKSVSFW